jgi:hypothetical protein
MAITKTTELSQVVVTPAIDSSAEDTANDKHPVMVVSYFDTYTEDGVVGDSRHREVTLKKFVEDGGAATDVSGEDAFVQTIATAIWS